MMNRYVRIFTMCCLLAPSLVFGEMPSEPPKESVQTVELSRINTLDLNTAKRIAVSDNPTMAAARARVRQAMERVRQADAAYWPTLDASATASHERLSDNYAASLTGSTGPVPGLSGIDRQFEYYTAGLTASWVLFDGFARKFTREVERLGEKQAEEADLEARRLLLSSIAATYYNAQLAMENIIIATADEGFNQRQVTEAEARLRVGTGALSDVLNFKVQVNAARSRKYQARLEHERFLIGLAALMGVPHAELPETLALSPLVPEIDSEMTMPEPNEQISQALSNRPDLQQRALSIRQANSQIELARSEYYPTLSFSASLNGQRYDDMDYEADDFGYSIGLNLTCNLFSGGITRARVREALWTHTEAEKSREELSITVATDVRNAIADLNRAQAELKLQRANTVLVEKNRDLVQREYAAGQGTLVRLNEAQRDLTTARSRLALALVSLRLAWQNLETATGKIVGDLE